MEVVGSNVKETEVFNSKSVSKEIINKVFESNEHKVTYGHHERTTAVHTVKRKETVN